MNKYSDVMKKCISLAQQASGQTSPNPMVGCVVLNEKGDEIATGYHKKCGEFHAERDALNKLENAKNCTLVVNLEPCCHQGKTPPCTDIIIEKGVKKVVYGMKDVNPLVSGKGIEILKNAGIEVIGPVLEEECKKLNEIFIKNKTQKLPFVAIKTATTIDGKISTLNGDSKWITSEKARQKGKELRSYYDAILTSSSTVLADNPEMKHNTKIILDRKLKTDINSKIYQDGNIYVFCENSLTYKIKNISYIKTPVSEGKLDIDFILKKLFEFGIMSVFVEAGGILSGSFLPYADKLYHFTAPKILSDNNGKPCFDGCNMTKISQCFQLKYEKNEIYPPDILNIYSIKPRESNNNNDF